jgi:hypothetical protein
MSALKFFTDFALNGQIEGVGLNSTPAEWAEGLGTDFIDDKSKSGKRLRRDYGLVELGFVRAEGSWSCFLISIQAHRLWQYHSNVPRKLIEKYGEFPRSVQFDEVRRALHALGYEPELVADEHRSDTARYRIPGAKVLIAVVSREAESDYLPTGSIWSMELSESSDIWARPHKG